MYQTQYSEMVLTPDDLCDLLMRGHDITEIENAKVDAGVDIAALIDLAIQPNNLPTWCSPESSGMTVPDFHARQQQTWFMPDHYRDLDVAQHVLDLCVTPQQLQRVGQELLLFQERDLFDLLKYLIYLVDVMKQNQVIWGVGRGSCVASYVLYVLGVHRIDSLFYDLDPREFFR
jgi:DNA polymerase III alpha subunit